MSASTANGLRQIADQIKITSSPSYNQRAKWCDQIKDAANEIDRFAKNADSIHSSEGQS